MTNERVLLAEVNTALREAWNARILPADAISADLIRRIKECLADEPREDLMGLLREIIEADDANVDTATTLPYELMDRARAAVNRGESREK